METVEVDNKKVGGDSQIKLTVNSMLKIVGGIFVVLQSIAGWAYFDLRSEIKKANTISAEEKRLFLKEIEDDYDGKFEKMFDDVSEMKGDIKVILDRQNRDNPVTPNPHASFEAVEPPTIGSN
jgi:hypothetical protein